jgi:phage terminase large subunit-like protein
VTAAGGAMTALELLSVLRLEDGRAWAECATPLQLADARAVLSRDAGSARRHWLSRSKGYSKTTDVAATSLAVLLAQLRPGSEAYAAATDGDQAGLLFRAIRGFVTRTPGLESEVLVESRRVVAPKRGTELVILPADSAGSHGLRPSWLVVDEVCNWSEDERHRSFLESLLAGLPKVADSRAVIMSTAGSPGHMAEKYFDLAGRSTGWRLSHVEGPSPWWTSADVESQRRTLMPSSFEGWIMNRWTAGADDRLANWEQLRRAAVLDGPQLRVIGHRYYVGADLGLSHDRSCLAVVHSELAGDGSVRSRRFFLDRMMVWSGRADDKVDLERVEEALLGIHGHYDRPEVRLDPWQGEFLAQRLRKRGVNVELRPYSQELFDKIATKLGELFRNDLIALPNDADLLDELATVKVVEKSPGRYRVDTRTRQQHDDRAMALGYAVTLAADRLGSSGRRPLTPEEREEQRRANRRLGRTMGAQIMTMPL